MRYLFDLTFNLVTLEKQERSRVGITSSGFSSSLWRRSCVHAMVVKPGRKRKSCSMFADDQRPYGWVDPILTEYSGADDWTETSGFVGVMMMESRGWGIRMIQEPHL